MKTRIASRYALALLLSGLAAAGSRAAGPVLRIDANAPTKPVSPIFSGLMTEEINHSYDGGLYGELLQNRAFLDDKTNAPVHWTLLAPAGTAAEMAITQAFPLTDKLPNSLEIKINKADPKNRVGVANDGYWGIPVKPDTVYQLSFYAAGNAGWEGKKKHAPKEAEAAGKPSLFRGTLHVSLESADGSKVYAQADTQPVGDHWGKFEVTLKTGKDVTPSAANRLVISAGDPGILRLSLVSLFPPTYKNRPNGNRIDLMEKMAGLKPSFLRFPGGNYVEGNTLWERFNWKETRGPLEFRAGHPSCWNYRSTDGMGLLEFMGWCEDLQMEPVLAVFAGYSLQRQAVAPGPLLETYVREALEEIEYLTGDAKTTYWGGVRAADGHPVPFKLRFVEIGNEDQFDHSGSYDGRFAMFYDAIKAKYPDLQLIATKPVTSRKPDVRDDHYYPRGFDFIKDIHHYDKADRNGPKIFVGEWATREGAPTPNMMAALGDAAWMTGMERNSDLIIMHCYAPLFANVNPGGSQWTPDLIGYDALHSYASPAYYAQMIFRERGDSIVPAELQGEDGMLLPYSVTRDAKNGRFIVKLVNPEASARKLEIKVDGAKIASLAEAVTLSAKTPQDTNSITEPDKIKPVASEVRNAGAGFSYELAPYSVTVLKLRAAN